MRTVSSTVTVADFCQGLERDEYQVNREYQRSDRVWPAAAKSFLIETLILDYPVPKLSLHQRLDLLSRKATKEIVDGQQRTGAIREFYQNRLRLSRILDTESIAGRTFAELESEDQASFLNYGLSFDIFVNASNEEVREVFRRMNSFTVPLNNEETRHASFQGPFKWYILRLTRRFDEAFKQAGVFTERQVYRMADAKLLTEVSHALVHGITTTNKSSLDSIYRQFDVAFPNEDKFDLAITQALKELLLNPVVRDGALAKPLQLYSLVLGLIQAQGQIEVAGSIVLPDVQEFRAAEPDYNLSVLSEALNSSEQDERVSGALADFVAASRDRTNVASQRKTRFEFYLAALTL